jgi:16S rRNA processing protein RimM
MGDRRVLMGVIGRPHGVRGLLHVHSYTADPADLPSYGPFADDRGRAFTLRWHSEGVAAVREIVGGKPVPIADRAIAEALVNTRLYVDRDRLPPPDEEEFYLADLVGLMAVDADGRELGRVDVVHDYGAGTSLEIGTLLIPFTRACVPVVDIAAGRIVISPPDEIVVAEDASASLEASAQ